MNIATRVLCTLAVVCGPLLVAIPPVSAAPACLEPGGMGGTGAVATGGIGGTGAPMENGGIGGTGSPAEHGGIGGTGAPAGDGGIGGTGIVGTITGFGSICVNGVEVHFDNEVALSENGVPASANRLAIGQVVAVEAGTSARGLEARRIAILHAYEGPVTEAAKGTAALRVMGQPVRLAPGARVAEGLRIGEPVRVSGLRNALGEVIASRIDRAPKLTQVSAVGAIQRPGVLQGLALSRPLPRSAEVLVRGTWDGKELKVAETRVDPGLPFGGRSGKALVEGLVYSQQGNRIEFGGFTAYVGDDRAFAGGKHAELAVGQRIRVRGVFEKGRTIRADHIEVLREHQDGGSHQGSGHLDEESDDSGKSGDSGGSDDSRDSGDHGSDNSGRGSGNETRVRVENGETRQRVEREVVSPTGDLQRRERIETRQSGDRVETRERIEIFQDGVRVERIERIERIDRPDKADKPERVEKVERVERVERPETVERPESVERAERVDHSGPH